MNGRVSGKTFAQVVELISNLQPGQRGIFVVNNEPMFRYVVNMVEDNIPTSVVNRSKGEIKIGDKIVMIRVLSLCELQVRGLDLAALDFDHFLKDYANATELQQMENIRHLSGQVRPQAHMEDGGKRRGEKSSDGEGE